MKKSNNILIPEIQRLIQQGHMVEFRPHGYSMRPFIEPDRHKVLLKACKHPQVGMIVLAKIDEHYVLHRIYHIQRNTIILQGDGNLSGQEQCTAQDIIGRVVQLKTIEGKRLRLTRASLWRRLPVAIKRLYLKIYRKLIILS